MACPWRLTFFVGHASEGLAILADSRRTCGLRKYRFSDFYDLQNAVVCGTIAIRPFCGVFQPFLRMLANIASPSLACQESGARPPRRPTDLSGFAAACLRATSRRNSPGCVNCLVPRGETRRRLTKSAHPRGELRSPGQAEACPTARYAQALSYLANLICDSAWNLRYPRKTLSLRTNTLALRNCRTERSGSR